MSTWVNPLTGSDTVPDDPGEIITAAISYHMDQVEYWRGKRPRKPAERAEKQRNMDHSVARLNRLHSERVRLGNNIKKPNKLTIALATDDLAAVMRPAKEKAA